MGKLIRFSNDAEGFKEFASWNVEIKARCNKHNVMVGMEPTGHYWFNIAPYLKDHKMKIVLGRNIQRIEDGYGNWQIVKQLNAIRNRVKRWISIYFPEFNRVFGDWEGKAALIMLKEFSTPAKLIEKGIDGIIARWKQDKLRAVGRKRAIALIEAARILVGVSEGLIAAENDLAILIEDYEMRMRQYERTMLIIEQLAYQIPGMPEMLKIKGIGLVTAASFIAEVGDISRFEHPKQIQKLAGLSLKENSSGKHKGKTTISKRGRRRLRALLFQGIMPVAAKNPEFRELHSH